METKDNYGMTPYMQYIHLSRYSRWIPEKGRRETWPETVARYFDFFDEHLKTNNNFTLPKKDRNMLEQAVLEMRVMPSMRCLMTAGEALKRDNLAGYNCSYIAIDSVRAFDEILYVLMNGVGVGFSVEIEEVRKLPLVAEDFHDSDTVIIVPDSKLGWAKSFKELVNLLYSGQIPKWDISKVRAAGEPLKTFGGRASGPEPLVNLFEFAVDLFRNSAGRKLTSLECHDLVCKIAEIVVVGGVRRSALISLSNLNDDRMQVAKSGQWWETNGQRALANNSAAYNEKPAIGTFMDEWKALYDSKSGERGIFNREAAKKKIDSMGRRDSGWSFGLNPCGEILLRPRELCNLSESIVRSTDTEETLAEKVRLSAIIGTLQSTLTNFKYVTRAWAANCNEERLLGVSMTGIMDSKLTNGSVVKGLPERLERLRQLTIDTNAEWADKIGIPHSKAITCTKPSGTVSELVDASSGIHAAHNPWYIRTVRADKKDPLESFMRDAGFHAEDDVMKPDHTTVFSFPKKADKNAVFRNDRTAIEQLEHWLIFREHWCEHNPSVTITVKEDEWLDVGAWVYKNFDNMAGVSFLPHSDHIYKQAPFQDCTEAEYNEMLEAQPKDIDWSKLSQYELTDMTEGAQTLACVGPDGCVI